MCPYRLDKHIVIENFVLVRYLLKVTFKAFEKLKKIIICEKIKMGFAITGLLTTAHWSRMKSFFSEIISIEILSKDTSMDLVLCKKKQKSLYFSIIFFRDFYLSVLSLFLSKINQIMKKS